MKKYVVLGILLAVAIGGALYYLLAGDESGTEGVLATSSGTIEVTEVTASFRIPGHMEERLANEGEVVRKGDLLARLDTSELRHEVALRRAELDAARAALGKLEAGYRPEEVAQARAARQSAGAEAERARSELRRQQDLFGKKVISEREYEVAVAEARVAEEKLREAEEQLALLAKGYRREEIEEARARAAQAQEALALAETRLGYAVLASPLDAVVLSDNIEPGEHVAAGTPVLTLGDLAAPWLRAYIDEADLGKVKQGQRAWVTTDTFPGKRYPGRVTFIASEAEFTPKQVQTEKQRTRLVYRLKIAVENPERELKPGMPAEAVIELEGSGEKGSESKVQGSKG